MWPTCRENHLKHMASFMGMLEMGSAYLPVDEVGRRVLYGRPSL
jgi:hypothetical protein